MQLLTFEDAVKWTRKRGLVVTGHNVQAINRKDVFEVSLHTGSSNVITCIEFITYAEDNLGFEGGLAWLTEHEDGGRWTTRKVFEQFIRGYDAIALPVEKPGHLFGPGEVSDLGALMLLIALFQWDAWIIPLHMKYFFCLHEPYRLFIVANEDISKLTEAINKHCSVRKLPPDHRWVSNLCTNIEP